MNLLAQKLRKKDHRDSHWIEELTQLALNQTSVFKNVLIEALAIQNPDEFVVVLMNVSQFFATNQVERARPPSVSEERWREFYLVITWPAHLVGRKYAVPREAWLPVIVEIAPMIRDLTECLFDNVEVFTTKLLKFNTVWGQSFEKIRLDPRYSKHFIN